jgi:uncharacterized protein YdhG (YjbR/CyaY superfamily)
MPMPKRSSVEEYFDKLGDHQRPHLETLRRLSVEADPRAEERLSRNLPVYVRDDNRHLWMLQNFKHHCSLRFPPRFFGAHKAEVEAAGYETGAGFIKLPYDRDIPVNLCRRLMRARIEEHEATGAAWSDD